MKEVDSQNDPGDGLDAELNTNKQEIDLSAMGPNLASPVALGYPAANQDDMAESISPEIALADLGVGTAFSSVTKDSGAPDSADSLAKLSEPEYPVVNLANTISSQSDWGALDHGNAVIADEDCSFGDTLAKLAKPKPKPEGWVAPKPTNPDDAQEGQYRFCARNPAILIDGLRRRNCVKSLDTFCAWGRVDLPIVDNCIGCMWAFYSALSSGARIGRTKTYIQINMPITLKVYVTRWGIFSVANAF